jgi:hypothetical protein
MSTTHQQHADTAKASSADAVASLKELGLRPVL